MADEWAIETEKLGRQYGKRWVVRELGLRVPRGAVYGFLGLNGAGKSTTIRMLMGLIRRHEGKARVFGFDPQIDGVELKRRVGYVAEAPVFYDWMTVEETCRFVGTYHGKRWNWPHVEQLLDQFRLPQREKMRNLSKGQRAKTSLVLALAFDPEVLILDEPTSGLDPMARREFVEGILAQFQESGKTIFVSSHLVNELAGLVDHVGILYEGQLLLSARTDDFLDSVRRVRLGFEGAAPEGVTCDGLLRRQVDQHEAALVVGKFDEARVRAQLLPYRPASIEFERLNLEDAFVEVVGAEERGRL
jgi:ABC-2 type transport system ATP-binding protein